MYLAWNSVYIAKGVIQGSACLEFSSGGYFLFNSTTPFLYRPNTWLTRGYFCLPTTPDQCGNIPVIAMHVYRHTPSSCMLWCSVWHQRPPLWFLWQRRSVQLGPSTGTQCPVAIAMPFRTQARYVLGERKDLEMAHIEHNINYMLYSVQCRQSILWSWEKHTVSPKSRV